MHLSPTSKLGYLSFKMLNCVLPVLLRRSRKKSNELLMKGK